MHEEFRVEDIAKAFHERYERLAPEHSYETRKASAVPWEQVPENNKSLMMAVVRSLLADGVILRPGTGSAMVKTDRPDRAPRSRH